MSKDNEKADAAPERVVSGRVVPRKKVTAVKGKTKAKAKTAKKKK